MCKVTIIVPVYNTEQYLPRCLDSILSQSFNDFELLLIDDGSTDDSGVICDGYSKKDKRIRVFHKENGGVSSARNMGIENAMGEWLYFVDSDDEVLPDGLLTLVNGAVGDVDVVMGGYVDIAEDGALFVKNESDYPSTRMSKKESIIECYNGYGVFFYYTGYLWLRLFRNNVVKESRIRFAEDVAIKEDNLFIVRYLCRSRGTTQITSKPVYGYYQRSDSSMGKVLSGFDYKYVSSFDALVRMKHDIETVFPWYDEVIFVAKQGIYGRCYGIIHRMEEYGVEDEALKQRLLEETKNELGSITMFKIRRKIRKLFKKSHSNH